ncbi:MAG: NAD-dependent epimerase/dehydratase family protein, partial [Myxococcota bacterium]
VDFDINARATLGLLELIRRYAPSAPFAFVSTNKVYGDRPNSLPLVEQTLRLDLPEGHPYFDGVSEGESIDRSTHSLFGVSKTAADLAVQEYGRSFGMPTACFRAGCVTGRQHSAVKLHGFLAYLARSALSGEGYEVIGYGGKQVRDNLHAFDLAQMLVCFVRRPGVAQVFNVGGGRSNSCSILEAVERIERLTGRGVPLRFDPRARLGDHRWYISNTGSFESTYPEWRRTRSLDDILSELVGTCEERMRA